MSGVICTLCDRRRRDFAVESCTETRNRDPHPRAALYFAVTSLLMSTDAARRHNSVHRLPTTGVARNARA